ncbi:MAG: PEP-CTERM sorting domain-containing protein [Isosphaeraceae bacterium]
MKSHRGWAALRTALTVVALGAAAPALASSSSTDTKTTGAAGLQNVFTYSTSGQIDPTTGVTGANVISYDSVPLQKTASSVNSFVTPTSFSLGGFRVGALPDGQMTTYADTPFSITLTPQTINGDSVGPMDSPVVLSGVLNGTVSGGGQSDVIATFKPTGNSTDPTAQFFTTNTENGKFANTLRILSDKVALVPSTSYGGFSSVQGQVLSTGSPIPEPTTIALFVTAAAGLGLRRRIRRNAA